MVYLTNTDGAVHALGNGKLLVYGMGADILNIYGPPYSTSSLFEGEWKFRDESSPLYSSQREKGTSLWKHNFLKDGQTVGTSEEFVATDAPAYFSKLIFEEETIFTIKLSQEFKCHTDKEKTGIINGNGRANSIGSGDELTGDSWR